jgi:hypothetical protein
MTNPFDEKINPSPSSPGDEAEEKKKALWKNLFLTNLCLSLLLIGIFWLPQKLTSVNEFLDSPSVNLPKQGEIIKGSDAVQDENDERSNLISTSYAIINASSEKDWAYFDLSRGATVDIHDKSSLEWDLAFRRGKVKSNGGATNKFGKAGLIDLKDVEYESVTEVPTEKYIQDSSTRTEEENTVLLKWYKYNYLTHVMSAKKNVYAFRTADNKYAKLQFLSFYCENDETGCIKIRYTYQDNGSNSFLLSEDEADPWQEEKNTAGTAPKAKPVKF